MTGPTKSAVTAIAISVASVVGVVAAGTPPAAHAQAGMQDRQYPCAPVVTGQLAQLDTPLAVGATGAAVRDWQTFLNHWLAVTDRAGAFRLAEDGDFGPLTDAVTRELQVDTGRPVDGIVGPETVAGYRSTGVAAVDASAPALLQAGSCGTAVAAWQERLNRWLAATAPGDDPLMVDGVLGPNTEALTSVFQSATGITVDGLVGPSTLAGMAAFEQRAGLPEVSRSDASAPAASPTASTGASSTPAASSGAPAAGICARPTGVEVVVALEADVASPRCTIVTPQQHLVVQNHTGMAVHLTLAGEHRTVAPGDETTFAEAFGQYLPAGTTTVLVQEYGDSGPQLWLAAAASG